MAKILIGLCLVNNPLSDAKKLDMRRVIVGGYVKVNGFILFNTSNLEMELISLSDAIKANIFNLELEDDNFENDYYKFKYDTGKRVNNFAFSYGKWLLVYENKVITDKPDYCISIRLLGQKLLYHIDKIRSINKFNLDIRIDTRTCYIICSEPVRFVSNSTGDFVVNVQCYDFIEDRVWYPRVFIGEHNIINLSNNVALWNTADSSGRQDILPNGIKTLVMFFDGDKECYNVVIPPSVEMLYLSDLGNTYGYLDTCTITFYISTKNKSVLLDALHEDFISNRGYDTSKINVLEY